jgi:hypothetical protein
MSVSETSADSPLALGPPAALFNPVVKFTQRAEVGNLAAMQRKAVCDTPPVWSGWQPLRPP